MLFLPAEGTVVSVPGMDTPVKSAKEFWESMAPLERTNGDKKLGLAVFICEYAHRVWGAPDADELAEALVQSRSGADGWATDRMIRAIEAAAEKQTLAYAPAGGRE